MYGENTKTIAIPIYRVLPYPVISLTLSAKPHGKFKGRRIFATRRLYRPCPTLSVSAEKRSSRIYPG